MAALKFGGRTLAMLAMASLGLASGCYSLTPHQAQVSSNVAPRACSSAVADVFAQSGFVQVSTPPTMSMLFTARTSDQYSTFLPTNTAVGVTLRQGLGADTCEVTIQAVSQDVSCPGSLNGSAHSSNFERTAPPNEVMVPSVPQHACVMTYAPSARNDAAVDELARRVRVALNGEARVNESVP
jgi:hypothetical protein